MSVQAVRIRGIGYMLPYGFDIPTISLDGDDQYEFLDEFGIDGSYYGMRDLKSSDRISPIRVFSDGMDGKYTAILIVTEADYIENSHGDERWRNKYRNDSWVKDCAKDRLKLLMGETKEEPKEIDFDHWQ